MPLATDQKYRHRSRALRTPVNLTGDGWYVKALVNTNALVPQRTARSTVPASWGGVNRKTVPLGCTSVSAAGTPPNVNAQRSEKLKPLIVTPWPPEERPSAGFMLVATGPGPSVTPTPRSKDAPPLMSRRDIPTIVDPMPSARTGMTTLPSAPVRTVSGTLTIPAFAG